MQGRLKIYGFTLLVSLGLAGACLLAGDAAIPQPVPDYALQSREIYRLEIGAASFVAFYLVAMALALALDGRGFAEFGTRGLKAESVVGQQAQQEAEQQIVEELANARSELEGLNAQLGAHEQRLKKLEAQC